MSLTSVCFPFLMLITAGAGLGVCVCIYLGKWIRRDRQSCLQCLAVYVFLTCWSVLHTSSHVTRGHCSSLMPSALSASCVWGNPWVEEEKMVGGI